MLTFATWISLGQNLAFTSSRVASNPMSLIWSTTKLTLLAGPKNVRVALCANRFTVTDFTKSNSLTESLTAFTQEAQVIPVILIRPSYSSTAVDSLDAVLTSMTAGDCSQGEGENRSGIRRAGSYPEDPVTMLSSLAAGS